MTVKLIKLKLNNLHLVTGVGGVYGRLETLPSDEIFSAFVNAFAMLGLRDGENKPWPRILNLAGGDTPTNRDFPFIFSSAFPYYKDLLFFPRPWVALRPPEDVDPKITKNIRFVSETIFKEILRGDALEYRFKEGGRFRESGKYWLTDDEDISMTATISTDTNLVGRVINTRVVLDTHRNLSLPYYTDDLTFRPDSGLFFCCRLTNEGDGAEEDFIKLKAALNYLEDEGFGGKRTWGHGQFKYEVQDYGLHSPANANYFLTLSLFHPNRGDVETSRLLAGDKVAYKIIRRGGYVGSAHYRTIRKKVFNFISEGSVMRLPEGRDVDFGEIVNVTPENPRLNHRVYRDGRAFSLPLFIRERDE